jgi:hypothetical protein
MYIAILMTRSFQVLMVISIIFNLNAFQYNTMNVFVNSLLDKEVHIKLLDGFKDRENSL